MLTIDLKIGDRAYLVNSVRDRYRALEKRRSLPRGMSASEVRDELDALERIYGQLCSSSLRNGSGVEIGDPVAAAPLPGVTNGAG